MHFHSNVRFCIAENTASTIPNFNRINEASPFCGKHLIFYSAHSVQMAISNFHRTSMQRSLNEWWMHERWSGSWELRIRCKLSQHELFISQRWVMLFKFKQTRGRTMATTSNRIFRFRVNRQWLKWNYNSIELHLIYDRNVMGKYERWAIMCVWQRESPPSDRVLTKLKTIIMLIARDE